MVTFEKGPDGKLRVKQEEKKVEEPTNAFDDLMKQTAKDAVAEMKKAEPAAPQQAPPITNDERLYLEELRKQKMQELAYAQQQAQQPQQQAPEPEVVTMTIVLRDGANKILYVPVVQLEDLVATLNGCIANNTVFTVENFSINCRHVLYYTVD